MTKARDLSDIFADANTANELVKLDGTAKLIDAVFPSVLPAIDGSNLTGVAETKPTISSISPDTITNASTNIVITGTNYVITPNVEIISTTGAIYYPNTVTRNSSSQLTINATLAVDGTYFIRVENPNGLAVRSSTALLTVSDAPTWTTAAGSLGSVAQGTSFSTTVVATSDSAITYSVQSGALPTGITLNTSTGVISGTESGVDTGETVYNFTLRATDAETQTADRAFTITVTLQINNAGQFN
jgi:large repetitive protein